MTHLAFWDLRVLSVLDQTEAAGKLVFNEADISVNDFALPLLAAIPPREAARLAIEAAEAIDKRLESSPPAFLEQVFAHNPRWVMRLLHRNEHLDESRSCPEDVKSKSLSHPLGEGDEAKLRRVRAVAHNPLRV